MMNAVLFDVDGTLIRLDGAGRSALALALADATGVAVERVRHAVDGIDFRGATDAFIVDEIARSIGVAADEIAARLMPLYFAALRETVAAAGTRTVLPGVHALLEALEARLPRTLVGLLTGNMRDGARIKLAAFGLERLVERPGGFGNDGKSRAAIARTARGRLVAAGVTAGRTVVVGDTEHDVTAARAAGFAAVAVATGWTPRERLEAAAPDLLLDDLSDPSELLGLLDRLMGNS